MTQRTPLHVERAPEIDDEIGRYRIIGVLGGGTFVAERRGLSGFSRVVALRCISPELARDPQFRAAFFEAAGAVRDGHPNLLSVHELEEVEGQLLISMECVPGEDLPSILTRCNTGAHMPPDIAAALVRQAASAVQYVHERRAASAPSVDHAQLDIADVYLTYHGTVKLLSVGLDSFRKANGAAVSGERRVDPSSRAGVTAEHIEAHSEQRTNAFNLAVLLWACLTGRHPGLEQGTGAVSAIAPSESLEALGRLRADVPEGLDAIVMRGLSPDPLERFASARALSAALDQYLLRRPVWPTPKDLRRWLEQLFGAERASLRLRIAQGHDVEAALSLLGAPRRAGGASSLPQPLASLRPRQLWSTSHSAVVLPSVLPSVSPHSRWPSAAPRVFEPGPGSSQERVTASAILVRPTPAPVVAPALMPVPMAPASMAVAAMARAEPVLTSGERIGAAPSARPPRPWLIAATLAACALVALGSAALLSSSDDGSPLRDASPRPPLGARSGRVDVRSTPEGAAVFIDGEPTGLRTPVVLKGLAEGHKLLLRVDKPGFASQQREIEVSAGAVQRQSFQLSASVGLVRFAGAPAGARVYVDDMLVDAKKQVELSVGRHTLRVETPGALMFSGQVTIAPGEQTLRLDGAQPVP